MTRETASSGTVRDGAHYYPIRIYYEDTDVSGLVYNANYLRYAERARTEYMRLLGTEHSKVLEETGVAFTVRHATLDFQKPARLDDVVTVRTRMIDHSRVAMVVNQTVMRGDTVLCDMVLKLACIDTRGRPVRLPAPLVAALRGSDATAADGGTESPQA